MSADLNPTHSSDLGAAMALAALAEGTQPLRALQRADIAAELRRLATLSRDLREQRDVLLKQNANLLLQVPKMQGRMDALQAQVDRLMLEFTPQDMSAQQMLDWSVQQVVAREQPALF